ncbi:MULTISPECIES: hypothetical protein [Serratia]|jgi:conjugal transfer ATP-binding protein TraC|uniref:TraG/VirB4 family ATPase n=1 Tax=Serratia TaxID=613 RepID=UPI001F4C4855|nr:hypothetical protein [Serratia proteamaculans]ULG15696.1 type IV secretion system protein TraC [Serratia proteamaculans]
MKHIDHIPLPVVSDWENLNWFTSGTASEDTLIWTQAMALQVLDGGGVVWLKGMGESHKVFCSRVGGAYKNGRSLSLNPFANVTRETLSVMDESLRELLCIMACPNGQLEEVLELLLLEAVTELWPHYQQDMRIDHVIEFLKAHQRKMSMQYAAQIVDRIDGVVTQLNKYTTWGLYSAYFSSSEPALEESEPFMVTDMLDLHTQDDLLTVGLCSMMLRHESLMYDRPRRQRKMDITDGCWERQSGTSDRLGVFVEQRYRMARRFNASYGTVSKNLRDKNRNFALLNAFNNSAFTFTLMQDIDALSLFRGEELETFSSQEWALIEALATPEQAEHITFLLSKGKYSRLHSLRSDLIETVAKRRVKVSNVEGEA